MFVRHTLVLWTDDDERSLLVEWKAEEVDGPGVTRVATDLELRGSTVFLVRCLSTALTLAMLKGPEAARERLEELQRRGDQRPMWDD